MAIGIVALADLVHRYAWDERATVQFARAAGLAPAGEVWRSFEPPRVVVAIVPPLHHAAAWCRAWLSRARHVLLVHDMRMDGAGLVGELGDAMTWRSDADCPSILEAARALAATVDGEPEPAQTAAVVVQRELPAGPWIAIPNDHEWIEAEHGWIETERVVQQLDRLDLASAPLRLELAAHDAGSRDAHGCHTHLHADPVHPIHWRGHRMSLSWHYHGEFLDVLHHDYPCGPAKKLYGFDDNDPVQICMAPTADAFAARFLHDVTFSTAVPIAWQRAGAFEVAYFERDPQRAVFFGRDPAGSWYEVDADDEDARDAAPALVLGPGMYALDLSLEVHRIAGGGRVVVGGPGEGYAVFTFDHALVRRGGGRLLGGWYRYATIEDAGAYWREDLVTGERTRVAPVDLLVCDDAADETVARDAILEGAHEVAHRLHRTLPSHVIADKVDVVALPGTRNVVLVTPYALRVI